MTNQTKNNQAQFKEGIIVWIPSEKTKGKITGLTRSFPSQYLVEIITSFNKDTQERTTKLLKLTVDQIAPYKPKKKQKGKDVYNQMYYMVKDFHKAFNHPIANKPTPIDPVRLVNRQIWTAEELVEGLRMACTTDESFEEAVETLIEGIKAAKDKSFKDEIPQTVEDKIVGQADALTDALYFILGSFVELGMSPYNLFKIVQDSNMSKLFTDEQGNKFAKYREDGKILKSPQFFAPEDKLKEEVLRQIGK